MSALPPSGRSGGRDAGRRSADGRFTIGLLLSQIAERYQASVWAGLADAAREEGVNLLFFMGSSLQNPAVGYDVQGNLLYDLVGKENVDGLVIMSGSVGQFVTRNDFRAFCERYSPLPMVSIALELEGIPSVLVDNRNGMREAVVHLLERHGCRRLAFICGPEGHGEAEERYRTYAEVLAEHGLALDPALIAPGDFTAPSGAAAIELLVDQRKVDFDALVVAGDTMALAALEALEARGLHVPYEVALVGFDDIEDAQSSTPSLTTVRQPLYEQGGRAAEMVLAQLRGEEVPLRVVLPTKLVVRQSCGCLPEAVELAAVGQVVGEKDPFQEAFAARREQIRAEMVRQVENATWASPGVQLSAWVDRLLDAFVTELGGGVGGAFLGALDEGLRSAAGRDGGVLVWQGMLSAMRRLALPTLTDRAVRSRAEDLWQQGRVLIGDVTQRAQVHIGVQQERQVQALSEISQTLTTTVDLDQLVEAVARGMPTLGIRRCYLSLYEGSEMPPPWARLILCCEDGQRAVGASGRRFPTCQLVPAEMLPRDQPYALVVVPLYFRETQLGLGVFEMGPREGMIYQALRGQLSSALYGALLFRERGELLSALEDRALQLRAAAEISRTVSKILDLDELLQRVVALIGERFGYYYVGLFLVDQTGEWTGEPGKWAVLRAASGEAGRAMVLQGQRLAVGRGSMIGWVAETGQARLAPDVTADAEYKEHPLLPETRSEMALPLRVGEHLIGVLDVQSHELAAFDQDDMLVLQTVADQLAVAIENARAVSGIRRINEDLERTLETQEQLLETIQELSTPVMPLLQGAILLPLVGQVDSDRAHQIMAQLLAGVQAHRARIAILDITGVALVDTAVANSLIQAAAAVNLLGAEVVLVGIRPEVAQTIVGLGVNLPVITKSDLQSGIDYALERLRTGAAVQPRRT